jgi:hypothetical protein
MASVISKWKGRLRGETSGHLPHMEKQRKRVKNYHQLEKQEKT